MSRIVLCRRYAEDVPTPHSREQAIYELVTHGLDNPHAFGEDPATLLHPPLRRLAVVVGDQKIDYAWATVNSSSWTEEAGILHVLVGNAVISTTYGRAESRAVKVEPLDLVDLDVEVRTGERRTHIPSGVHKVAVTLNRENGGKPFQLTAQSSRDDASVQALLDLVRRLMCRLGAA